MSTMVTTNLLACCAGNCELCNNENATIAYVVSPKSNDAIENEVALGDECFGRLQRGNEQNHWQCLAGSIWDTEPGLQALSYRMLYQYKDEDWARDIMASVELDESVIYWALTAFEEKEFHRDSNGTGLVNGDTTVLTQALNVKGASFSAPKGSIVRKIRLVPDSVEQIGGKINEQTIVILTKYARKSS